MSRTERGQPGPGAEWWGKRPVRNVRKGGRYTSWWKRRLHRIERREGRPERD